MSLNQITSPNTYLPSVSFNSSTINILDTTAIYSQGVQRIALSSTSEELKMPCSIQNSFGAGYNNKISMFADGTNTALKLSTLNAGAGAYIQFSNPNSDNDLRIGVSNVDTNVIQAKQNILLQDENFDTSITLCKNPGDGIQLQNPTIAGYNAYNFNAYMEASFSETLTGFTVPPTLNCKFTRVGNVVSFRISGASGTATGGIVELSTTAIPEPMRPLVATECSIPTTVSNSVESTGGVCEILTNGNISIEYTPGNLFPAQPDSGFNSFCGSYTI